ncbi:MAG TPA: TIM barrel protein [Firmicutes bacterium]|nr:TIM barrel protein [Bacillota bacterium]
MIGREVPFLERIDLAAKAGYQAIEFWQWRNKDLNALADKVAGLQMAVAAMVGSSGKLVDASLHQELVDDIGAAIEVAERFSCRTLIVTTGNEIPGTARAVQHENIVAGLRQAAPLAGKAGVTLVLEPLNVLVNHNGYYLYSSAEGFEIIREVASPAVRLLFDIYHQQVSEGNVTANMLANLDLIGHLHIADVPGRHEPGSGELNYRNILRTVKSAGYDKYAGLEFLPTGDSLQVLRAVRELI